MKILENLITAEQNDPLLFDNTLTLENIATGDYNLEIDNAESIALARNGTEDEVFQITFMGTNGGTIQRVYAANEGITIIDFDSMENIRQLRMLVATATEIQIGRWHYLSGGEVSSTGKRTTAQSERTASGVVFEDVAGYEYEEFNVQIPYITLETYNAFKNINLSVPHFVQFEGEFGRDDTVFCTIADLTVQMIGLQAGYTMQLSLREAK